tara:strand:- start:11710 stop:12051 length:342 start_codon:yes stop_codon:yes gene_type:complete
MPKYRINGKDKRRQPRKEIVDAHDLDTALSIAYARGISKSANVEIEELALDGSTRQTTQIDAGLYEDEFVIQEQSRLQRAPISTIALGIIVAAVPIAIIGSLTGCLRIHIWCM